MRNELKIRSTCVITLVSGSFRNTYTTTKYINLNGVFICLTHWLIGLFVAFSSLSINVVERSSNLLNNQTHRQVRDVHWHHFRTGHIFLRIYHHFIDAINPFNIDNRCVCRSINATFCTSHQFMNTYFGSKVLSTISVLHRTFIYWMKWWTLFFVPSSC